jgi:hypothetical protein
LARFAWLRQRRKSALQVAQAMEDNAAIDVGFRQTGIEIDRQVEVRERK